MLKLEHKITLDEEAVKAKNLCDRFDEEDLKRLGQWVFEGYMKDKQSRHKWEQRNKTAMDLALQIQEAKTFPWVDCSNVRFPLVTIAVMQFHARAYATIVDGKDLVKYQINGKDPSGEIRDRAARVANHMSWQLLDQNESWEPQHDRLLINFAVVGCAFKKSYYSGKDKYNCSDLVMAKDLVLDYWSKSVETAPRKTHVIPMDRNDIYERCARGTFRDVREEPWFQAPAVVEQTQQDIDSNKRSGMEPINPADETTPYQILEQHCNVDLDQDGYAEPYIITIEQTNKCVLRIVTRFDQLEDIERNDAGEVVSIKAFEHFTKYTFLPSPDGGIYDIGFGVLLGPLNESVNSLINQLIDAGTMAVTAGGFLGRGAKIRGGDYRFAPLEWKRVDSTGEDLSKSIFPLPVREPSAVLFQLLSLLVNYTQRISGSTDLMAGESPGQNTPAETSRLLYQEGARIYNSIFKRVWRAMKEEFGKLYVLNSIFLPQSMSYGLNDESVGQGDYKGDPTKIIPVADPNITSESMRFQQAQAVKASAMQTPGYDPDEVEIFYLKSLKVDGIETLFPGSKKRPPGPSEKVQIERMRMQLRQMEMQAENQQFAATLMEERRMHDAEILKIQADIQIAMQSAQTDVGDQKVNMLNAILNMHEMRAKQIDSQLKAVMERGKQMNERISQMLEMRSLALENKSLDNDRFAIEVEREGIQRDREVAAKETKEKTSAE